MERFKRQAAPSETGSSLSSHSRLRSAEVASDGGEHAPRFTLLRGVLLRYLGPILVDSALERALKSRRLTPSSITDAQVAELASDAMVGLRLFVAEDQLPQLTLDLEVVLKSRSPLKPP